MYKFIEIYIKEVKTDFPDIMEVEKAILTVITVSVFTGGITIALAAMFAAASS